MRRFYDDATFHLSDRFHWMAEIVPRQGSPLPENTKKKCPALFRFIWRSSRRRCIRFGMQRKANNRQQSSRPSSLFSYTNATGHIDAPYIITTIITIITVTLFSLFCYGELLSSEISRLTLGRPTSEKRSLRATRDANESAVERKKKRVRKKADGKTMTHALVAHPEHEVAAFKLDLADSRPVKKKNNKKKMRRCIKVNRDIRAI